MNRIVNPAKTESKAERLARRYRSVRAFTERHCQPLSPEDCSIQSMPDVSPTRWHLAHTTWFFETFVLTRLREYSVFHPEFNYLFNSYYNTVGNQFPRSRRGLLSRPSLEEILQYRAHVDEHMLDMLASGNLRPEQLGLVELGLHHEQQHQELILTDIKHVFSCNPLLPAYEENDLVPEVCIASDCHSSPPGRSSSEWSEIHEGVHWIGHEGPEFAYDNESPRHRVFLEGGMLAEGLVTCGEFCQFIEDGGYGRPELWLSQGWTTVCEQGWDAPLYWTRRDDAWYVFTLAGLKPLDCNQPVCHVSYFEADAYATWADARLPTESEWEVVAKHDEREGIFADWLLDNDRPIHPQPAPSDGSSLLGNVWQWTSSPYVAYPGYQTAGGALGEYNGKFMCNQFVLRGGSVATSKGHVRPTYRNFFPPDARWQFSGIRLAR